jgi:hypothetical protein
MKTRSSYLWIPILLALAALSVGCSDDDGLVTNPSRELTSLNGVVYAWYCSPRCVTNNRGPVESYRFSIRTGEAAKVTLIDEAGSTTRCQTDCLSQFSESVAAGVYRVIIETGYTWPADTFYNVELQPGDTSIDFDLVYRVTDPRNLDIQFVYSPAADSLGVEREWEALHDLNSVASGPGQTVLLDMPDISPIYAYRVVNVDEWDMAYITYTLPINRTDERGQARNLTPVMFRLREALTADSSDGLPDNIWINPSGSYLCLF